MMSETRGLVNSKERKCFIYTSFPFRLRALSRISKLTKPHSASTLILFPLRFLRIDDFFFLAG